MGRRKAPTAQAHRIRIQILPAALEDLERGRWFYVRQDVTVGDYFLDTLFADIDSLVLYAGIHPKVFGFHRLLAKRFPYAVYYRVNADVCTVYRILDCRWDPGKTTGALT